MYCRLFLLMKFGELNKGIDGKKKLKVQNKYTKSLFIFKIKLN